MADFTEFLRLVSGMESSFGKDPNARGNLYGMTPAAGTSNPIALAKANFSHLTVALGGAPSQFQQYLAWQQGATGAVNLLAADPNTPASSVVPLANLKGNIGKNSGLDAATMTTGQFLTYLNDKWSNVGGTPDTALTGKVTRAAKAALAGGTAGNQGTVTDWIAEYFARATIIILGFIFVAMGLKGFTQGEDNVVRVQNVPGPEPRLSHSERRAREEAASEAAEERAVTKMERTARRQFIEAGGTPYGMLPKARKAVKRRTKKEIQDATIREGEAIKASREAKSKTISTKKYTVE